jgi:homoserine kinase
MNRLLLDPYHVRLPATSANLGPAFDTAAVALNLHLEIDARPADEFSMRATGRDAETCERTDENLILDTYRRLLVDNGREVVNLHLDVNNEIPLGMGCGSSAAARLAGVALASHYGELGWTDQQVISAASSLEGHPDNVAACWLGGMTVATVCRQENCPDSGNQLAFPIVYAARIEIPDTWRPVMVLPRAPMRTEESRGVLPDSYSRSDVVENLQRCGLLVAAFATSRADLLQAAMHDRLHQPYRSAVCPLLGKLLPLRNEPGVLGVALSGAGPGILVVVEQTLNEQRLRQSIERLVGGTIEMEVLACGFSSAGTHAESRKISP